MVNRCLLYKQISSVPFDTAYLFYDDKMIV